MKRRGGCAVKEKARSHLVPHRRARSASAIARSSKCGQFGEIFRPETFAGVTTPSAPSKVASRSLFDVASTPPFQGELCIRAGFKRQSDKKWIQACFRLCFCSGVRREIQFPPPLDTLCP